jgi:hypothetical protein
VTEEAALNPVVSLETERLVRKLKADRAALASRLGDGQGPA